MNNKRILLISHNYWPEPTGIGKYNGEMIEWLSSNGYQCTVITCFPYYPQWKIQSPYTNRWYKKEVIETSGNPIIVYRCPLYVPKQPTGKRRMLQDMSFWLFKSPIVLYHLLFKTDYDLIITVAPPFHLAYLGLLLKKSAKCKLLYHIQDLQIEAAQDLNMLSSQKLFDKLFKIEKDILDKADFVSSISDGMLDKINAKMSKSGYLFPNWADTSFFYPIEDRIALKQQWGFKTDDIVFLYSGAIGEKQGLESLLFAADSLRDIPNLQFVICGSGPYREVLENKATDLSLKNLKFFPVQDKDKFNSFLNLADFHFVLQKANAGDLVLPSKLTTILAVGGVSIVTCIEGTSLFNVLEKYDMGYIVEPENVEKLLETILDVYSNPNATATKRIKARNFALEFLDQNNIMKKFEADFLK